MSIERTVLRAKAKKIYKEQVKKIPKKNRLPFAKFFKQFRKSSITGSALPSAEDFNFDSLNNVTEDISTVVEEHDHDHDHNHHSHE